MNRLPQFSCLGFNLPLVISLLLILKMPFLQITSLGSDAREKEPITVAGKVLDIDGQPAAWATIEVANHLAKIQESTVADQDGAFSIRAAMTKGIYQQLKITAASADGQQLWYHRPAQGLELADLQSMRIQLESTRSAQVRIQDPHGNAIPEAHVVLQLSFPNTIHAVTDSEGSVTFQIPTSEEIGSVVAWKDHEGLDYQIYRLLRNQENDQLSPKPEFPWESGEVLSLEGAAPLTVTFTDSDGEAISGIDAYVWLLKKQQLRDGAEGGIPWFCILDADGNKLATSNLPDSGSNVGFPSSAEGSEHFASMLKGTCQRLSEEEIDELVAAIRSR